MSKRKLIYLYVNSLSIGLEKQEFSFSDEFDVHYDSKNKKLIIEENKNYIPYFEESCINDITLLVGKNGSGKSTILDLLGSAVNQKNKHYGGYKQQAKRIWFAVYHEYGDIFTIEGFLINMESEITNIKSLEYDDKYKNENKQVLARVKLIKNDGEISFKELTKGKNENQNILYIYDRNNRRIGWNSEYNYRLPKDEFFDTCYDRFIMESPKGIDVYNFLEMYLKNTNNEFFASEMLASIKLEGDGQNRTKNQFILLLFESLLLNLNPELKGLGIENPRLSAEKVEISENELEKDILYLFKNIKLKLNDKYFTVFQDFYKYLKEIPEVLFMTRYGSLSIPIEKNVIEEVKDLMNIVYEINKNEELNDLIPLDVKIHNLSSGEANLLERFTKIYITAKKNLYKKSNGNDSKTIILLLDEPEMHFHPEWSRRFINDLVHTLNGFNLEGILFQIIIATHSPFLISDIPKKNIISIEAISENGETRRNVRESDFGLMSNFYEIIKSNFFMDQTIGEYANQFFKNIIKMINDINKVSTIEEINNIWKKINLIDEPFIKNRLSNYLSQKVESNLNDKEIRLINKRKEHELNIKEIDKEIELLKADENLDS